MRTLCCLVFIALQFPSFLTAQERRRTDLNDDELPPGAIARIGSARFRHTDEIYRIAFNPDGTRLASTTKDGLVSLWDAKTGKLIARKHAGEYAAVAFGDKGETIGTFSVRDGFRLFTANLEREIRSNENRTRFDLKNAGLVAHERQPAPVLAPGLRWLTYQIGEIQRCSMIIGRPETSEEVANLTQCKWGWLTVAAASQDGKRLAIGDGMSHDSTVWIIDPLTGKEISHRDFDGLYPNVISINRDGSRVAIGAMSHGGSVNRNIIFVWDTEKGNLSREIPVRDLVSHSIAISPDGERVAVTQLHYLSRIREEYRIDIYDVKTGKVVKSIPTRKEYGRLCYSPDGNTLYLARYNSITRYDLDPGNSALNDNEDGVFDFGWKIGDQISFRNDGLLEMRSVNTDRTSLWEPQSGKKVKGSESGNKNFSVRSFSPDGRQFIYSENLEYMEGRFRLWDCDSNREVVKIRYPDLRGAMFHFSGDNRVLWLQSFSADTWRLNRETLERDESSLIPASYIQEHGELERAIYSRDGQWRYEFHRHGGTVFRRNLISRGGGTLIRWSPQTALHVSKEYVGEVHYSRSFHVSADDSRLAVFQWIGHQGPPQQIENERFRGENVISVFDTDTAYERSRINVPVVSNPNFHGEVVLSPDGRLVLIYGSDHYCSIFETASGTRRFRISTHEGPGRIPGVGHYGGAGLFSPNGRYLVTYNSPQGWLTADLHSPEWHARSELRNKDFDLPMAWDALQTRSAEEALPALNWLIGNGDRTVDFLAERIRVAPKATLKDLERWLADLDSESFDERSDAEDRLRTAVGFQQIRDTSIIRQSRDNASVHVRKAIDRILESSGMYHPAKETIRAERALEILERINTAKSRHTLTQIANGHSDYWLRRDARAALLRLGEDW